MAVAGRDLAENDSRQDICGAALARVMTAGSWPRLRQADSFHAVFMQQADCLVIRPPARQPSRREARYQSYVSMSGVSEASAAAITYSAKRPTRPRIVQLALDHVADADDADQLAISMTGR